MMHTAPDEVREWDLEDVMGLVASNDLEAEEMRKDRPSDAGSSTKRKLNVRRR